MKIGFPLHRMVISPTGAKNQCYLQSLPYSIEILLHAFYKKLQHCHIFCVLL